MNEPDDIRAAAVSVYTRYLKDIGSLSLVDLLAEAIMAERNRCLEIALQKTAQLPNDSDMTRGYTEGRLAVVAAIRRGTP